MEDADVGEATSYLDGGFDGYQTGLPLQGSGGTWEVGTDVWVEARQPTDLDAFGRSDSEGADSKMQIMDAFIWGRCLSEDDIVTLHNVMSPSECDFIDMPEYNWHLGDSPSRIREVWPWRIMHWMRVTDSVQQMMHKFGYKRVGNRSSASGGGFSGACKYWWHRMLKETFMPSNHRVEKEKQSSKKGIGIIRNWWC